MDPAQTTPDGKDLRWEKISLLKVALLSEIFSEG